MTKTDKAKAKAVAAFRTHETGGGKLTPFAGYDVIAQNEDKSYGGADNDSGVNPIPVGQIEKAPHGGLVSRGSSKKAGEIPGPSVSSPWPRRRPQARASHA